MHPCRHEDQAELRLSVHSKRAGFCTCYFGHTPEIQGDGDQKPLTIWSILGNGIEKLIIGVEERKSWGIEGRRWSVEGGNWGITVPPTQRVDFL